MFRSHVWSSSGKENLFRFFALLFDACRDSGQERLQDGARANRWQHGRPQKTWRTQLNSLLAQSRPSERRRCERSELEEKSCMKGQQNCTDACENGGVDSIQCGLEDMRWKR